MCYASDDVQMVCSALQVGRQPVHYAAEEGHLHAVEVLIDHMGDTAIWNPVADQVGEANRQCNVDRSSYVL